MNLKLSSLWTVLFCAGAAFGQQWFFNWDGTTDITCVPTIEGNNAFYQGAAANSTFYWEIADNGSGGKAFREVVTGDTGFRWYGYGSRPEYYRGPCDTFAMENLRADRNAFTFAYRIKTESCSSTSNVRFFNCEFETTVLNPFWPSGGAYEPYYAYRVEFALRKGTGNDVWLYDNRQGKDIFQLKANNQAAAWHAIWGMCELPPYPYTTTNCVYRLWIDGTEVAWDDRDRGGWSDCEVAWTPTAGRYATFALDYLCYTYGAYQPGSLLIPAERVVVPTNSIAALKAYADGRPCQLTNKVVMGIFTDPRLGTKLYYVCEPDGTDGIKVTHNTGKSPHNAGGSAVTLAIGNVVSIKGGLNSADGEKQISAHDITYLSAGISPAVALSVSNADLTNSYNAALYADVPAQLLATAETGVVGGLTATTITDAAKNWTVNQWMNMTVFLPATASHPDLYYYVLTNTNNMLMLSHRTIRPDFNLAPDIAADGVLAGDAYEFVGGKPISPRLDGRLVRTAGFVTAVNVTAGYFDVDDGGGSGDTRTLQDIWDTMNYGSVFTPPNGIRVYAASPLPIFGDNVAVIGCAGASRFRHQVSTTINGSPRDEVKIDKVLPMVWGQKWTAAPTAGSNGPICAGSTLNLTASAVSGGTYAWTGPNGFVSSAQNPSIPNATTAASGEYSVSVTVNGCTSPAAKTTATVRANTQITAQPVAQNACPGNTAAFTVGATGDGAISYRWQKNNVDLVDGGHYSGVASETLTVSNADSGDVANYGCVVTAGCGSISSGEAAMTLRPVIAADLDGDCDVDATDIEILVSCGSGPAVPHDGSHTCRRADFDSDNDVDPSDFSRLQRCLSGTDASPTPDCMN